MELGFADMGVCAATTPQSLERFHEWLERGYAGQMHYLPERAAAYGHPDHVLEGVRSLVVLTTNYRTAEPVLPAAGQGKISRYAWGVADYHDVIHMRLKSLRRWLDEEVPGSSTRGVIDTAPLLERDLAVAAGLGWQGKNTLLLKRDAGSLFFLAVLLTDIELDFSTTVATDHCGTCTACLDACPTKAFPEPYVLDATQCISYLTIELRDEIPIEYRDKMDDWLFGCDVCQDVCPWNRHAPVVDSAEFQPLAENNPVDLIGLFDLDDDSFRTRFRKTPLWRSKRRGILRNAAILLGAQRHEPAVAALTRGLSDEEELIREACAWALREIGTPQALKALTRSELAGDCGWKPQSQTPSEGNA
ncbi:MAG: tRNA epoxyqueuosine(34) reductase QueG [Planctomycetota bacterium]